MKKKIAIVTISCGVSNFGNKLQNYAVQSVVEKLGYEPETLLDCRWLKNPRKWMSYVKDILHIVTRYNYTYVHLKNIRFRNWSEKYLRYSSIVVEKEDDLKQLSERYDWCFIGSDQLWNPEYHPDGFVFGTFMPGNRRIAIAPSFGVSEIPMSIRQKYAEYLKDYRALSARELAGSEIIESLTGRKAETLIDPTMMLTKEDWTKMANTPRVKGKYVLYYRLGESSDKYEEYVKRKAEEIGAGIINLSQSEYGAINPSEFIGYIKNAEWVVTDSFHGSVFSILFERDFTLLNRISKGGSMNSRMETLLKLVGIKFNGEEILEINNVRDIDNLLLQERDKVWNYLKMAIGDE